MEVMPGYKQTEVGVIPEDWDLGELGRYWHVIDCKHMTAEFVADGFPIASIKEVQNRFVDLTNAKYTTQRFYALLIEGGRNPKAGDLILSRNATVGEIAQVAEWHPPFAMGQDVSLLRKKSPEFSTIYLQAVFRSSVIARQLSDLMVGSTFKRVNIKQIKNFLVPMPPALEQEAIAEVLSKADAIIESYERLIAKKRLLKKGVMQKLLRPKDGWLTKSLGSLATLINGRAYSITEWEVTGTPVIRLQNLTGRGEIYYYSTLDLPEKQYCHSGDLLFMWSATFGPIIWRGPKAIFHYHIWKIECQPGQLNKEYLYHLLSDITERLKSKSSNGGTMLHLTKSGMEAMEISIPSYEEQETIAAILSAMDAEIALLEAQLAKYRQLKQGLMQKLLTGRIRLV